MYAKIQDRRGLRGVAERLMEARYATSFQLIPRSFIDFSMVFYSEHAHDLSCSSTLHSMTTLFY
jgi:hypothetical protein